MSGSLELNIPNEKQGRSGVTKLYAVSVGEVGRVELEVGR